MKKVSIVMPVFNGEQFLKESIESIINQNYRNWELIIVNDCSTDNTLEIANFYGKKDKRINIVSNEKNLKIPSCLNVGFENATGDYYTWTVSGNIYKPFAIERMVDYLEANPDCDMVSFNTSYINNEGFFLKELTDIYPNRKPQNLKHHCNVGYCFMYTKGIAQRVGKYDENNLKNADYDYWLRLNEIGNICYEDENLYRCRVKDNTNPVKKFLI